ncbi:helix-turn-helix domain-containing protein [Mariniblastus fucicola]|uniref:Helix-turn-helix protein n=1 Tax=Mariniblastus fucicola TaxID=980251 RepID=A0A5B9PLM5_9BACT|nr:helix-turn-helix transcriptional regulator [Mariniblastus fucicola]QEG23571.1 helix-turn-helix protein [Mariniblastus fucicola]
MRPTTSRGLNVNSHKLKEARKSLGLTQEELAQKAELSVRYIRSIEGGRASPSGRVLNEMVSVFQRLGEACETKDFLEQKTGSRLLEYAKDFIFGLYIHEVDVIKNCRHFLDDDVTFHFSGEPEKIPFAGSYRGIDQVQNALNIFFSILQPPENHDPKNHYEFVLAEDQVIVWGESWLHPHNAPMTDPIPVTVSMKFENDLLTVFDDRFDTAAAAEVINSFRNPTN